MLLRSIGALTLALRGVDAFKNSAPFFMLSNRPFEGKIESAQVMNSQQLGAALHTETQGCVADSWTIIEQPGLTTADLKSLPNIKALVTGKKYNSHVEIANVLGEVDSIVGTVRNACDAVYEFQGTVPATTRIFHGEREENKRIVSMRYEALPMEKKARAAELKTRDEDISAFDKTVGGSGASHVLIFMSSPAETTDHHEHMYEMDEPYPTAMHQDLKRGLEQERRLARNSTDNDFQAGLPLFEVYQFLSPGIFMGLTVSLLLIVILWVGVSAIAGLEVSYMAFSKEMGPAAQNKGKQQ